MKDAFVIALSALPYSVSPREPIPLRGALRLLHAMGHATLTEVPLRSGHRADILSLDANGTFAIVEVKSCLRDFKSDSKWPCYLEWCDSFYFAVGADFPREHLPSDAGVIISDRHDGIVLEAAPVHARLSGSRRRALTLRFARLAAARLAGLDGVLG